LEANASNASNATIVAYGSDRFGQALARVEQTNPFSTLGKGHSMSVPGPSVWTGRALQAENDDLGKVGLALLYPAYCWSG
jgi:hypothetical protein